MVTGSTKRLENFTLKMTGSAGHRDVSKTATAAGDVSATSAPPTHQNLKCSPPRDSQVGQAPRKQSF